MPISYIFGRLVFHLFAGPGFAMEWELLKVAPAVFLFAAIYQYFSHVRLFAKFLPHDPPVDGMLDRFWAFLAVLFFLFYNQMQHVDDAGFILRYLENFGNGCWYCFNVEDGPIFGLSAFLYGGVAGLLVVLGLSAKAAMFVVTLAGIYAVAFLLLRILRTILPERGLVLLLWFFILLSARTYLKAQATGMEVPFHLAICLAAFLFVLQDNRRLAWLFLALAVISKLDAVPFAGALGAWYLYQNRDWKAMLLWAGVPLILFLAVTLFLFGSPFPHSAATKLTYVQIPHEGFFPFWADFLTYPLSKMQFFLFLGLVALHHFWEARSGWKSSVLLLPGWAFAGTLLLYWFYAPGEHMMWYYALPEMLMLLQLGLSLAVLLSRVSGKWMYGLAAGVFTVWLVLTGSRSLHELDWFRQDVAIMDGERARIGEALASYVQPGDTLLASHGLTSWNSKGYVLDVSGLNSKLAVEYDLKTNQLIEQFRPKWIVNQAWEPVIRATNRSGYIPIGAAYDVTLRDGVPWQLWQRSDSARIMRPLPKTAVSGALAAETVRNYNRFSADALRMRLDPPTFGPGRLQFGVWRAEESFSLVLDCRADGRSIRQYTTEIRPFMPGEVPSRTALISFEYPAVPDSIAVLEVRMWTLGKAAPFTVVAPNHVDLLR